MKKVLFLLLAPALLSAGALGCDEEPSPYGATTPAAETDADARIAEAEARAAAAEAQLAQSSQSMSTQPTASVPQQAASGGGSAPGAYTGNVDASGARDFCENYERTSVAEFVGMEVCYHIEMTQRGGSLQGTGYKSFEALGGTPGRDLGPGEDSPIRLTGHIDSNDTIHLEYTVQGTRRSTKGTARIDARRAYDNGGNPEWGGTFRTSAADASGRATYTGWALKH